MATTALVAVLLGSLFSGWLANSPQITNSLKALAVDDPIVTRCTNAKDGGKITASNASFSFDNGLGRYLINLTLESPSSNQLQLWGELYRKPASNTTYDSGPVDGQSLPKVGTVNGVDKWQWSPSPGNGTSGDSFVLLVSDTRVSSSPKDLKCFKGGGQKSDTGDREAIRRWFDSVGTIGPLPVNISEDKNKPPTISVPAHIQGASNPAILFTLVQVSGTYTSYPKLALVTGLAGLVLGSFIGTNTSWAIFEAQGIPNLIILGDNKGSHWEMYYVDSNFNSSDPTGSGTNPVSVIVSDSFYQLYRYVNDVPKAGSTECADGVASVTGPTGNPKTVPGDNDYIKSLNSNCIDKNGSGGWIDWWGITSTSQASDAAGNCGITNIIGNLKDGLGSVIAKMIGCVLSYLVTSTQSSLEGYLCTGAKISIIPPVILGRVRADNGFPIPDSTTSSPKAVCSGTATIGNGGKDNIGDFESELRASDSVVHNLWKLSIEIVNVVVIIALLLIAFANILHLNINTYTAKKALPALIIGVIGANASLLMIRFLADLTGAVSIWMADIGTNHGTITSLVAVDFPAAIGRALITPITLALTGGAVATVVTGGAAFPIILIVGGIVILYYLFLIVAFLFALLKRIIILYFLTILAPLAFIAYGVPNFQQYFYKWWEMFIRFMFLFPIILFGMAITVKIADAVGTGQLTNIFSAPGLVGVILVLAAATMVLKLPKIVTKGLVDAQAMVKKTLGAAPRIASGAQGIHQFAAGGGYQSLMAKAKGLQANSKFSIGKSGAAAKAKQYEADALARRQLYKDNKLAKGLGKFRGYSSIFGNPEMIQGALTERTEAEKKADIIAAATRTGGILNVARGPEGAFKSSQGFAEDALKNASTMEDFEEWMGTAGTEGEKEAAKAYRALMPKLAGASATERQQVFAQLRGANNPEKVRKILDKFGISEDYSPGAFGDLKALITKMQQEANRQRLQDTGNVTDTIENKQSRVFPSYFKPPFEKPPGDGGTSGPGGGRGPSPDSGDGVPFTRGSFAADQAQYIRPDASDDIKQTMRDLTDQWRDAMESSISAANDPAQLQNVQTQLDDIKNRSIEALGSSFEQSGQQLVENLRSGSDDVIRQTVENVSAAMDEGINSSNALQANFRQSLEQKMAAAHKFSTEVDNVNRSITSEVTEEKIVPLMGGTDKELTDQVTKILTPQIDRLARAAGKQPDQDVSNRLIQAAVSELRQVFTDRGPSGLRGAIQSSFTNFGGKIAKEWGMHQISTSSIATAISQAQQQAPKSANTTNVTIEPPVAGQPPLPNIEENPEPPTTPDQPTS